MMTRLFAVLLNKLAAVCKLTIILIFLMETAAYAPVTSFDSTPDLSPFDSLSFPLALDWSDGARSRRQLQDGVQVNTCMDTLDYFRSSTKELLESYFDCSCSGDLASYYTLSCSMRDYCFIDQRNSNSTVDSSTQRCVHQDLFFEFSTDSNRTIQDIWKSGNCIEYLDPAVGKLCEVEPAACALFLKDYHNYGTEAATTVCSNATSCYELLPTLNYTQSEIDTLCAVSVQLDDIDCKSLGAEVCQNNYDDKYFRTTPDCSNVNPCATSFCEEKGRSDSVPERFIPFYPDCPFGTNEGPTMQHSSSPVDVLQPSPALSSAVLVSPIYALGCLVSVVSCFTHLLLAV